MSCFFWFVVTEGNDGSFLFHGNRFLDGWQKYRYEWNDLIDEWKKENVENASCVRMWKRCVDQESRENGKTRDGKALYT